VAPELHAKYDCQVQDLTLLLLGGAPADELGAYLRTAEQERMGVAQADEVRLQRVVERLAQLREPDAPGPGDASAQGVSARTPNRT
jgi:hypothetical protein